MPVQCDEAEETCATEQLDGRAAFADCYKAAWQRLCTTRNFPQGKRKVAIAN